MNAADTNVLIRFLTADDSGQFARAERLLREGSTFICTTVVMETEWVLRSVYRYRPARIAEALRAIAGLPGVTLEHPDRIFMAIDALERGLDFADALHLASCADADAFVTFNRLLIRDAARIGGIPVREP